MQAFLRVLWVAVPPTVVFSGRRGAVIINKPLYKSIKPIFYLVLIIQKIFKKLIFDITTHRGLTYLKSRNKNSRRGRRLDVPFRLAIVYNLLHTETQKLNFAFRGVILSAADKVYAVGGKEGNVFGRLPYVEIA